MFRRQHTGKILDKFGVQNPTTKAATLHFPVSSRSPIRESGKAAQTQETVDDLFQVNENVSYVKGDPRLKFGMDLGSSLRHRQRLS